MASATDRSVIICRLTHYRSSRLRSGLDFRERLLWLENLSYETLFVERGNFDGSGTTRIRRELFSAPVEYLLDLCTQTNELAMYCMNLTV